MSSITDYIKEENLDKACCDTIESNINMCVPWYLMATYSYYIQDDPIISDSRFDRMVKTMIDRWDEIDHEHKNLISESDLQNKTYSGEYPKRIENAVKGLKEAYFGKQKCV